MPHPTPDAPGYFWAKLVHPRNEPDDEDWTSIHFEVVQVDENYGEGEDHLRVYVPGIGPGQLIDAFIWGARVPDYQV